MQFSHCRIHRNMLQICERLYQILVHFQVVPEILEESNLKNLSAVFGAGDTRDEEPEFQIVEGTGM